MAIATTLHPVYKHPLTQHVNVHRGRVSRALDVDGDTRKVVLGLQGHGVDGVGGGGLVLHQVAPSVPTEGVRGGSSGVLHVAGEL